MGSRVCTSLESCLEGISAARAGEVLTVRLEEGQELPCLAVSCVEGGRWFTCSLRGNDGLFFLVEDEITEEKSFLAYIEKELAPEQMLLSLEAVRSAAGIFYEYRGDVQQCAEWIHEWEAEY